MKCATLVLAGLALLAGVAWMLRMNAAPGEVSTVSASEASGPIGDAMSDRTDVEGSRHAPPTPPPATPLPELWTQLGAAARAGHAPSACRLAIQTLRCAMHQYTSTFPKLPASLPSGELEALEAFVADPSGVLTEISAPFRNDPRAAERMRRVDTATDRHCGNVATERRSDALALLRQSALAGLPDAQLAYVTAFSEIHLPGAMGDPTFERWMEEVPTVMTRMLDAGHPDAPSLFAEAYARDRWHGHLFPFDLMRSVAYGQLDQRIGNDSSLASRFVDIRRQALTAAQRAEADQLTAELHAAHYAGRARAKDNHRRNLLYSTPLGADASGTARDELCQPQDARTEVR